MSELMRAVVERDRPLDMLPDNLSLIRVFVDRIEDVALLDGLLQRKRERERERELHEVHHCMPASSSRIILKQRRVGAQKNTDAPRTRTASYMRYKTPPAKRKKRSSEGGGAMATCRHQRRTKAIMTALHNLHSDGGLATRWLETHFWHRKRFVMATLWGYCLPVHHNGRGLKFLHAAMRDGVVVHDGSYVRPIVVTGVQRAVNRLLGEMLDPSVDYLRQGTCREVDVLLYRRRQFPADCIGPATLCLTALPTAIDDMHEVQLQVWLWCHPAIYSYVLMDLTAAAGAVAATAASADETPVVAPLTGGLVRFCVRGRRALTTLRRVLHPTNGEPTSDTTTSEAFFAGLTVSHSISRFWPTGAVLGLRVRDVRTTRGAKWSDRAQKSAGEPTTAAAPPPWPREASASALWSEAGRVAHSAAFVVEHVVNAATASARRDRLRPLLTLGASANDTCTLGQGPTQADTTASVAAPWLPVLVIRKDMVNKSSQWLTKKRAGEPSWGFDVVLPARWGPTFWTALQLAGACAVGTDEWDAIGLEGGLSAFPRDFPDTAAGAVYWASAAERHAEASAMRPRSTRQGRTAALVPRWSAIGGLRGLDGDAGSQVVVARDERAIRPFQLRSLALEGARALHAKIPAAALVCGSPERAELIAVLTQIARRPVPQLLTRTLLPVLLTVSGRGRPQDGSEIMAPTSDDCRLWALHHLRRASPCKDAARTGSKRVGEWRGLRLDGAPAGSAAEGGERTVLGFVTSGMHKGSPAGAVCVGLCDGAAAAGAQRAAAQWALALVLAESDAISDGGTAAPPPLASLLSLVLFRSPNSDWLRPAFIDVVAATPMHVTIK